MQFAKKSHSYIFCTCIGSYLKKIDNLIKLFLLLLFMYFMNFSKYLRNTSCGKGLLLPFLTHVFSLLKLFYALPGCVSCRNTRSCRKKKIKIIEKKLLTEV